MSKTAEGFDT
uniref:Uncharacterized protein n=1 Tax=Rhizophora mucronata TaxID=61149 RepID=A0A2P2NPP1_RHIMU